MNSDVKKIPQRTHRLDSKVNKHKTAKKAAVANLSWMKLALIKKKEF